MGANFAARRVLFDRVGAFDEVLGGGGPLKSSQDFDFLYRVFRCGYSTLLEPDVVVYHYGCRTFSEWPDTVRSYGIGVGGFFTKHVRMGDAHAAYLFLRCLARAAAHVVKEALILRDPSPLYLRSLLSGVHQSFGFAVDRDLRLYRAR
jgi:GT2 family glycosyltransferase